MQRSRVPSAVLALASLLMLAACGAEDPAPTAAATSAPAASTTASDVKICTSVQKLGNDLKDDLLELQQSKTGPTPAALAAILTKLEDQVAVEAFSAGDSAVAVAARELGSEAAKAAKDPSPAAAIGTGGFEKAETTLTGACKAVGVTVYF
ncbi:hypothetical protein [Actinoplanes sp. NPDC051494]|uniref:hypothetical protein n=1 Tax=Actinoplanes sp. NPDC051494 TaxID=3363907 RepID=UPI00378DBA57